MSWFFLSLAILTEIVATMSLRASEGLKKKLWLVPIVFGYLGAFGSLSLALAHGMPLGVGYGIWVACGVALTSVASRILFKEPLTPAMAFGILLISAGVLVVEIGAGQAH
jgi:small multidrug resistance pump